LDAVVVSHLHLDHVLDLLALRFALAYNPCRPPGPVPLWMPPGGNAFLHRAAELFAESGRADEFFPSVFAVAEYDPARSLAIGNVEISFARTTHFVPCWAMRVERPTGGPLVYTADTGPDGPLTTFAAGASVLIAEANSLGALDQPPAERGHLTADEAGQLARDAGASTLVLAHLWEEYGFETLRAQAAAVFRGRIELAKPGLHVEC
jgi:ribonuclease BN (tRNA processing enzyme)